MRERLQMYICLQLSLFLHYGLLNCVASEVQGQSIRAHKHELIKAMNIARRSGLNVARYERLLHGPPLTSAYENKIELGQTIGKQLQQMETELANDSRRQTDWKVYYRHEPSILIVDTTDPRLLDSWIFVYGDGAVERHSERYVGAARTVQES